MHGLIQSQKLKEKNILQKKMVVEPDVSGADFKINQHCGSIGQTKVGTWKIHFPLSKVIHCQGNMLRDVERAEDIFMKTTFMACVILQT